MADAGEKLEKLETQALTTDELRFLEAIKRTRAETTLPPEINVDVGAIAAKAFASYLEGLEDPRPPKVVTVTPAGLTQLVAQLMPAEPVEQQPSIQFRRDFLSNWVFQVFLVIICLGYLFFRSRIDLPYSRLAQILMAGAVVGLITFSIWFLRNPDRLGIRLNCLKYSAGSLASGLAALAIGLYGFQQWQQDVNTTKIDSTSRALAEVGFAAVGTSDVNKLKEKALRNFVELEKTTSLELVESGKPALGVKLAAKPENVPTSVILQIEPYRANVTTANSDQPAFEVLTGTVNKVSNDGIEINSTDLSTDKLRKINLTAHADQLLLEDLPEVRESGLQGREVKVLFVPKSSQTIKMSLLRQGAEPKIIYNADSVGLKRTVAILP